jgi:hypothetical protein
MALLSVQCICTRTAILARMNAIRELDKIRFWVRMYHFGIRCGDGRLIYGMPPLQPCIRATSTAMSTE